MGTLNNDWYLCDIDRKLLRTLSKRSDRQALIWFGGHISLLLALGALVTAAWGGAWAIPSLLIYSALWGCAASAVHETCHKTPFRSRWLNEFMLWLFGCMVQMEPVSVRWGHLGHHSFTHFSEGDTELSEPNPMTWKTFFTVGSGIGGTIHYSKSLLRQAFGRFDPEIREAIPTSKIPQAVTNARFFLGIYAAIVVLAVLAQSWLPVALTFGARIIGGPITGLLHLTQHTCLQMDVKDHRLSTRSFTASAITRFFYFNMNYHIEHHMFPMVPFYNLPQLNAAIKDDLPQPCDGLGGVFREIFAAIKRQRKDPAYCIRRTLPGSPDQSAAASCPSSA